MDFKKKYISAKELTEMLGLSEWKAYQLCRELNKELSDKGYIVLKGKIPIGYLMERLGIE